MADANIEVFENGNLLGNATYSESSEVYVLDFYPSAGNSYSVLADVNGYPSIKATTNIPTIPDISGCFALADIQTECTQCLYSQAKLTFRDIEYESKFWISSYSDHFGWNEDFSPDSSLVERSEFWGLYSTSPWIDPFNAIRDRGYNQYNVYMHINVEKNMQSEFSIDVFTLGEQYFYNFRELKNLDERLGLYIVVMAASEEFDQYMKDVVTNYNNDTDLIDEVPNPFSERIEVFSNIENGIGIFAGYNPVAIPVHKQQCE